MYFIPELDSPVLNVSVSEESRAVTIKAGEGPVEFIATVEAFPKRINCFW